VTRQQRYWASIDAGGADRGAGASACRTARSSTCPVSTSVRVGCAGGL